MNNDAGTELLQPEDLAPATEIMGKALEELDRLLLGRTELHRMVLIGILGKGHILLEGLPGLGKTQLIRALGDIFQLEFKRIQFTPDLMPSDIVGTHILQQSESGQREMVFQPGPVFTNILLADEINRASPKTQSAMLETMQERSVTLLGQTRPLPSPFVVLASQNPIELEGTYPLPEAQLDRFIFKLIVPGSGVDVLDDIISTRRHGEPPPPVWRMSADELNRVLEVAARVFLPKPVSRYIARLVSATHSDAAEATTDVKEYVSYGASPRAAIAMAEASRCRALMDGRPTVGFEDVRAVAAAVLNHRVILNYKAKFDKVDAFGVVDRLVSALEETGMNLPDGVTIEKVPA